MATLAEIRAKLTAADSKNNGNRTKFNTAVFPHWKIQEGSQARLRFLPDADTNNTYFWVEQLMIKLPFSGIKGQSDGKPCIVQVPCMEMYGTGEACPILTEVRPWFKANDPALEKLGKTYWKKKTYLFQGFVHENPLAEENAAENPIRRFMVNGSIYNIVKAAVLDPEMEELPIDYLNGLDFQVVKTSKGGFADYSTSKWARKESALTAVELEAIEKYGLFNLADYLPKKPDAKALEIIKEMFEASLEGELYDPVKWGAFYKPPGLKGEQKAENAENADVQFESAPVPVRDAYAPPPVEKAPPFEIDEEDLPVFEKPALAKPASNQKAEDILAMIRNRKQ